MKIMILTKIMEIIMIMTMTNPSMTMTKTFPLKNMSKTILNQMTMSLLRKMLKLQLRLVWKSLILEPQMIKKIMR